MIINEWKKQQVKNKKVNYKEIFEFIGVGIVFWLGAITLIFGFWTLGGCPL